MTGGFQLTAGAVAVALVAACQVYDLRADEAFQPDTQSNGCTALPRQRARLLAAAGLMLAGGLRPGDVGRVFQVDKRRLSPAMRRGAGITPERLDIILAALRSRGVVSDTPQPAAVRAGGRKAEAATDPRKVAPAGAAGGAAVRERNAPAAQVSEPVAAVAVLTAAANPVRERPPAPIVAPGDPTRVKPRVLRWCRAYVAGGVGVKLLADLFDLEIEDLRAALLPKAVAA